MSKGPMLPRLRPHGEVGTAHIRTLLLLVPVTLALLSWLTVSFVAQRPLSDYLPAGSLALFGQAGRSVIYDLLDDELYIPSGGESLLHKQTRKDGPWSISLPANAPVANAPFYITIACDASIIGHAACAPQYELHLRGPIAWTVAPDPLLYTHDAKTGTTHVRVVLPQAGVYEVWAWPDWEAVGSCPMPQEGPWGVQPVVRGSGGTVVVGRDLRGGGGARDDMRPCDDAMYRQGEVGGRWVSVGHIREKYRGLGWAQAHISKAEARSPGYPDYVYVPYTCKRAPLDYARALDETGDLTHLAYVGDSILRTSYCGHLFRALHGGEASGVCEYSENLAAYHWSDKSFTYRAPGRGGDGDVRLSQRFVNNNVARSFTDHVDSLAAEDRPVSHLIVNVGLWLAALSMDGYVGTVGWMLERLVERVGDEAKIVWVNTPAIAAGLFCWNTLKREQIEMHSFWAAVAIGHLKKRYPGLWIVQVDAYGITDARPDTTSDGRHWVKESDLPTLEDRPFVGRADDAIMEWAYDAFRASWRESQSRLGVS